MFPPWCNALNSFLPHRMSIYPIDYLGLWNWHQVLVRTALTLSSVWSSSKCIHTKHWFFSLSLFRNIPVSHFPILKSKNPKQWSHELSVRECQLVVNISQLYNILSFFQKVTSYAFERNIPLDSLEGSHFAFIVVSVLLLFLPFLHYPFLQQK